MDAELRDIVETLKRIETLLIRATSNQRVETQQELPLSPPEPTKAEIDTALAYAAKLLTTGISEQTKGFLESVIAWHKKSGKLSYKQIEAVHNTKTPPAYEARTWSRDSTRPLS